MDDQGDFASISWRNEGESDQSRPNTASSAGESQSTPHESSRPRQRRSDSQMAQAGPQADDVDLAGVGDGVLLCTVNGPQKENDGTKDAFVSYLITTHTDFKSFQKPDVSVRRRFTDFVFLYKTLGREYPECAVPPLPDKHKMEYVRGDRFGPDFTSRRAHSLNRFLKRMALHPRLRRCALLLIFLESPDWNAQMRARPQRAGSVAGEPGGGVFDNFADTFVNAFSKVNKPDKRFIDVRERADKLDEDLGHVEKIIARVARRQGDLESDYAELAIQFQKLVTLESGVEGPLHSFAASVDDTSAGFKTLKEHTDQNYLGSLRDMEAYIIALKSLLKVRDQKQLDFEALTEYLSKAGTERDTLASAHGSAALTGPGGFIRSKIEDVRGIDHETARRDRVRKLELRIEELTREVEEARRNAEAFDEEVVHETADFERIKAAEFRDTLGGFADAHVDFFKATIENWERYIQDMEPSGASAS
ncbi:MAG: intercellular trafficking and secretion [Vezdaea aestivalis]|nr:MAG: intercellular trafficking and secretion [Vezdaea aestivalis]